VKYNEFRRWLESQGAVLEPGKGSHMLVRLNGRTSVFPNHGAREMGKGLENKIRKDLGLK
jgi:mRNA interferase HicA